MFVSKAINKNKYLAGALLLAFLSIIATSSIFGFQKYGDTDGYIEAIHYFRGESVSAPAQRVLRPLGPFLAAPFEFLGDGAGLVVQNIVFFFLSVILIFKITELIFQNKKQALLSALFFIFSIPVIERGLSYLTDMGGWFFYLLSLFLTLLYFQRKKENPENTPEKQNKNKYLIGLNGFLSGIGFLIKENGALGSLFFGLMMLFSKKFSPKQKVLKILWFGSFMLAPIIILQVLMFKYFGFTSLDWYLRGKTSLGGESALLFSFRYIGQLFVVLGILWPFVFIGLWKEIKEKQWQRLKTFLALLPSSLSFLLWTYSGGARVVFIFAPLGILLASRGLLVATNRLNKKTKTLLLIGFFLLLIIINYSFCWFNPKIAFTDKIAELLKIL